MRRDVQGPDAQGRVLDHLRTRAQNFNAANSTLKVLGDKESLTRIAELTTALLTHDLGGSPQRSDKCATAVDQFVDFARRSQRLVQGPPFQEKDTFGTEQRVREAAERAAQEAHEQLEIEFAAVTAAAARANQALVDAAQTAREAAERAAQEARDNLIASARQGLPAQSGEDVQKRAAEAERAREAAERAAEEARLAWSKDRNVSPTSRVPKRRPCTPPGRGWSSSLASDASRMPLGGQTRGSAGSRAKKTRPGEVGMCWHRSVNILCLH